MEGPRRAPLRLAAACCLLAGLLLPPPGDGQEMPTDQPTTTPDSLSLSEAGSFSPKATASSLTSTSEDVATLQPSVSSPHPIELDASSAPLDPRTTTTTAVGLQPPATVLSLHAETGLPSENPSANSSSELPPPDTAVNTTEASQPDQKGTEPSSSRGATTGALTHPTPTNSLASTGSSQLRRSTFSTLGPTTGSPEPTPQTACENKTEQGPTGPTTVPAAMTAGSTPANTTPSTTTETLQAASTERATTTAGMQPSANPVRGKAAVLDVGDDDDSGQDLPSSGFVSTMGTDPLVIGVISVFVIMVGILALVGFLRYRQRNSRMEFRRLQDLPMDDMMEDTPLSLYSY